MFKRPQETVRDNKSSSYPVFELPGVNCIYLFIHLFITKRFSGFQMQFYIIFYKQARKYLFLDIMVLAC